MGAIDPLQSYRQRVADHPDNELARFSLAKALFDQGQFAPAREQFKTALARKPGWMMANILLAKCELALGNLADAKAILIVGHELAKKQNHQGPLAETRQLLAELSAKGF